MGQTAHSSSHAASGATTLPCQSSVKQCPTPPKRSSLTCTPLPEAFQNVASFCCMCHRATQFWKGSTSDWPTCGWCVATKAHGEGTRSDEDGGQAS